jgi:GDP-mannose 6-dehydrogenase
MTLVGHNHAADAAATVALYQTIDAPLVTSSIRVAEMIKYASNAWHALKVCFGNEIGNFCKKVGVDSHDVMDVFCRDDKLNQSLLRSNRLQIQHALDQIVETGRKRVGLLGFSFKAGTDDLRESPMVILAETLLGKGYTVGIYDQNVLLARLTGSNKEYIERQIPHLSRLLRESVDQVLDESDVIVVGNAAPEFGDALVRCRPDQMILDLVRVRCDRARIVADYRGICW